MQTGRKPVVNQKSTTGPPRRSRCPTMKAPSCLESRSVCLTPRDLRGLRAVRLGALGPCICVGGRWGLGGRVEAEGSVLCMEWLISLGIVIVRKA